MMQGAHFQWHPAHDRTIYEEEPVPVVTPLRLGDTIEAVIDTQDAPAGTRAVVMAIGWTQLAHGWRVRRVVARIITPPRRGGTLAMDVAPGTWRAVPRDAGWTTVTPSFLSLVEPGVDEPVAEGLRRLA